MILKCTDKIDISKIADSGQCFRWRDLGDGRYLIPAFGKYTIVSNCDEGVEVECESEELDIWKEYFDIYTSYDEIEKLVDKDDRFLSQAAEYGNGVRILKQEPFEMLISFIISQRKSIPAIKTSIEKICALCGKKLGRVNGEDVYAFPTPEELYNASHDRLEECGLGYRLPYIESAVSRIHEAPFLIDEMTDMDDEELFEALKSFYGVGDKVASCTMLFGFYRLNTFPIDVWIKRSLDQHYKTGFPFDRYEPYNGVMQQFIFEYYRRI